MRYFFHVINGHFVSDQEGTECASLHDAKLQATRAAGEMLREQGEHLWRSGCWDMYVCDEHNVTCLKLSFEVEQLTPVSTLD